MGGFPKIVDESESVVSDFSMVLERAFNPHQNKSLRVPFI